MHIKNQVFSMPICAPIDGIVASTGFAWNIRGCESVCGVLFITEAEAKADVAEVAEAEEAGEETEEADTEAAFKCSGTALIRAVGSDASTT